MPTQNDVLGVMDSIDSLIGQCEALFDRASNEVAKINDKAKREQISDEDLRFGLSCLRIADIAVTARGEAEEVRRDIKAA